MVTGASAALVLNKVIKTFKLTEEKIKPENSGEFRISIATRPEQRGASIALYPYSGDTFLLGAVLYSKN